MFPRLIYLKKKSTFPSVKTTVDTPIDVRNETSKHHLLKLVYLNGKGENNFLKVC